MGNLRESLDKAIKTHAKTLGILPEPEPDSAKKEKGVAKDAVSKR